MSKLDTVYKCHFCNKSYDRKSWFDKHNCKKANTYWATNEKTLNSSYNLFVYWQKRTGLMRKGKTKTFEEFNKSWFFAIFKDLVVYLDKNYIINYNLYIDFIVDKDIKEKSWKNQDLLVHYKKYSLEKESYMEQALSTKIYIKNWCDKNNIKEEDFFDVISNGQYVEMITNLNIKPWVIFSSEKSIKKISSENFPINMIDKIDKIYNIVEWDIKIKQNPNFAKIVNDVINERNT